MLINPGFLLILCSLDCHISTTSKSYFQIHSSRKVEDLLRRVKEFEKEINILRNENAVLRDEHTILRAENAELRDDNAKLRADNAELRAENAEFRTYNVELRAENAELRSRWHGDSHNTHKPPSSDGYRKKTVKPVLPKNKSSKQVV